MGEYKSTVLYPYKIKSADLLKPGEHKIDVKLIYDPDTIQMPAAPADLTLVVNCKVAGFVRVEKSMTLFFDASETFDVGVDLGAPVSRQYEDRLPFPFNGKINSLKIKYVSALELQSVEDEESCPFHQ